MTELDPAAYPPQLLDDHLAIARHRRRDALVATALRTRSVATRMLLAHAATGGRITLAEVVAAARAGSPSRTAPAHLDPTALADLGRVIALQNVLPEDPSDGLALLELALTTGGPDRVLGHHQGLHAQLAFHLGDHDRVSELLAVYRRMHTRVRDELELDLANPVHARPTCAPSQWLERFTRMLPEPGVALTGVAGAAPFDQLTTGPVSAVPDEDPVSVIVTSYCPDDSLLTSVRSLLVQSWANLEVLLVDDGSPESYAPVLHRAADLDPRVRLIRLDRNGGTYLARNAGLDEAQGRFVTFQDSDDWSHPGRVAQQVQALQQDPSLVATCTTGLRLSERLVITVPGRQSVNLNTSSLTFRREPVLRRIGYFDRVRKGADTEYMRRMETAFGAAAVRLVGDRPYALIRRSAGSLTARDFAAGWWHPGRVAYRNAYEHWHERVRTHGGDLRRPRTPAARPFPVPPTHALIRPATPRYDVVLVGDWCKYGGPQQSMLAEIEALTRHGLRVGVLDLQPLRFMQPVRQPLCRPVQALINAGTVDQLLPTEPAEVALLLVRYPPVLQFPPAEPTRLRARRVVILANQAPSERDGSDLRYVPRACTEAARRLFGAEPVWCPQGPEVRDQLGTDLGGAELSHIDLPGVINLGRWRTVRSRFRGDRPVLGRHARDHWTKWPPDARTLERVYPGTPEVDVRILGGARVPRAMLGGQLPPSWVSYGRDEIGVRNYLNQLDFFVYFPHPQMVEAFGRAILEALAAGCLAVLPHRFRRTFGDAAVYCDPGEVRDVVADHYARPERYRAQLRTAEDLLAQRFSYDAHLARIAALQGE